MKRPTSLGGLVAAFLLAVPALAQGGEAKPATPAQPAARLQPAPAQTQGPSQEQLRELRTKKLAKEVFQNAAWTTDFDAARKDAKAQDKLILVYFTRSYAG